MSLGRKSGKENQSYSVRSRDEKGTRARKRTRTRGKMEMNGRRTKINIIKKGFDGELKAEEEKQIEFRKKRL